MPKSLPVTIQSGDGFSVQYTRMPGRSERFKGPDGSIYSRRTIDNLKSGKISVYESKPIAPKYTERTNKFREYIKLEQDYKKAQAEKFGVKPKDIKVRGNSESAQRFKAERQKLRSKDKSVRLEAYTSFNYNAYAMEAYVDDSDDGGSDEFNDE